MGIARLDGELTAFGFRPCAGSGREFAAETIKLGQGGGDPLAVELPGGGKAESGEFRSQIRYQSTGCAEGRTDSGNDDALAAEPASDGDAVEAGSAATTDQNGRCRIDALVDRDIADSTNHLFGRHRDDCECRLVEREPQRLGDMARQGSSGGLRVEHHGTAEKICRIDVS